MTKSMNFRTGLAIGAVLLIGIAILLNRTVSNLGLGRFDLTEDRAYTISDGAKNILAGLDVPVQVKYYVTPEEEMPAGLKTLQQEVTDKLSELSIASRGMLEYQLVNPKEDEELETALQGKGIRPFQVQSVERDALAVKLVYSSLGIGYKDEGEEIMPQVLPDNMGTFEYELLSRLVKLVRDEDPVVTIFSTKEPLDPQMAQMYLQAGQPLPEPQDNFALIPDYLRSEGYDVRTVDLTEASGVPEETATLLLFGVRELNDRQRYEIHQVLKRGGNVVVATQATVYEYNPGPQGGFNINVRPQTLGVNDLLSEYGVRIDQALLMDSQMATLAIPRTQTIGGMRFQMSEPVQAPMQIRVMGNAINRDLPFTAGVPELLYLWGNRVLVDQEALPEKGLQATTIFSGSESTWTVEKSAGPLAAADLSPEGQNTVAGPTLAVLVEGMFPDPWADAAKPEWPATGAPEDAALDTPEEEAGPEAPPQPGRLLVIGCSKLFEEMLLEQAGHALLLLNTVDALTLGNDLISIRSKNFGQRTFGEVSDGKKLTFRLVNMALVPLLLVGIGFGNRIRRRREAEEYAERVAGGSAK